MKLSAVKPQALWVKHQMPKVDAQAVVDTFVSAAQVWAPSGQEKPMADLMVSEFQALDIEGLKVEIDDAGNRLGSDTPSKRLPTSTE